MRTQRSGRRVHGGSSAGGRRGPSGAPSGRLISAKNRWILPKTIKESVDLPDFVKESVSQTQILCTFQAGFEVYLVMSRLPAVELL